jgi:hypothetical protein
MKVLPIILFTTAMLMLVLFSPQHHALPRPGEKLGTSDTRPARPDDTRNQPMEGLEYRSLAYEDMAITLRDSLATGHTVDGVGASPDFTVCTGEVIPYLACRQSIPAPTIPDVKPMWTISFDDDVHGVVTELNSEGGSEG